MKKSLIILPLLLLVVLFAARCAPRRGAGITFMESNWQEVLSKAKAEHKPIFLDIYASWCGPCKMLKNQTFTDSKVAEYFNEHFVNASFDGEVGDGVALAEKYGIQAYPSLFIVDANGKVITNSVGFQTPKDLLKFGKQVINNK